MLTYHSKLAFGIQKYFPGFSSLDKWGGADFSEKDWEAAVRLNYGEPVGKEQAVPLRSVFQFLKTGETTGGKVFPYAPLSIETKYFFPENVPSGDFDDLAKGFEGEWKKVSTSSPEAAGETLLFLAKKYLSKIGCSAKMAHISAFEHIKTTAALAQCIERGKGELLLVGVGLDNIQGFCYDIVSSKAAKSLKGRSFYLQMLLDTIAQDIIRDPAIDAELGHIVYARGGKMYLLLPGTEEVMDALDGIRSEMIASFWQKFKSSLYCYLQYAPFSANSANLSGAWADLKKNIRHDKNRKYHHLLITSFNQFFEPIPEGFEYDHPDNQGKGGIGKKQFCRVTGEVIEAASLERNNIEVNQEEPPIWVTESVKFQSDLGEGLRNANDYLLHGVRQDQVVQPGNFYFTGSPSYLALPKEGKWMRGFQDDIMTDFVALHRRCLNQTDFLTNCPNGISCGFTFYGGNDQPKWTDEDLIKLNKKGSARVKDFEDLADRAVTGEKFTRLGVARLDLDNLGQMAERVENSFALNATFSAQLDVFLSGYINTLWKDEHKEYKDFLNIVFAGGDDMLLVGRWDLLLDFIGTFQADFYKFLGDRDDLTFSAGMVLVTPKFPIAKAVKMAGEAQGKAKKFNSDNCGKAAKTAPELPEKNAFCLLGEVISWQEEYRFAQYFSKKLEQWSNEENTGVSASLLNRFIQFHQIQKDERPNWRWLSMWYFEQIERDNPKSKAIFYLMKMFLITGVWQAKDGGIIQSFKINPSRTLLLMAMSARLADFRSRSKKQEEHASQD